VGIGSVFLYNQYMKTTQDVKEGQDMHIAPKQLQEAREYVAEHRNINWYSDPYALDEKAIVEGVLNYGSWEDFNYIYNTLGKTVFTTIFFDLASPVRKRMNIMPKTASFFDKYLKRHA